jgi:hypothetical protein
MKDEDVQAVVESIGGSDVAETQSESSDPDSDRIAEQEAKEDAILATLDSAEEEVGVRADSEELDEEQEEAVDVEESQEVASPEMEDAMGVLRRDGFTAEDLEGMGEDQVLRLAMHRKKVQGDVDRLLREARADAGGNDDDSQTQEDSGETATAEATPEAPSPVDLRESVTPIAEYLGLDKEGTDLLVKFQESAMKPLQEKLDIQSQQFEAIGMQMLMQDVERARQGLEERFHQVSDSSSEDYGKVLTRMQAMYSDDYDTVDQLMEDAIAVEFSGEFRETAQKASDKIRKQQRNGLPQATSSRPDPRVALSADEREDRILEILESDEPDRYEKARALGGHR